MTYFAKLDENNVVVFVTVGRSEDAGKEAQLSAQTGSVYKETSRETRAGVHTLGGEPFRGNYAGIGFTYDEDLDAFIPPKPSEDAVLDEETFSWIVPDVDEE